MMIDRFPMIINMCLCLCMLRQKQLIKQQDSKSSVLLSLLPSLVSLARYSRWKAHQFLVHRKTSPTHPFILPRLDILSSETGNSNIVNAIVHGTSA